MQNPFFAPTPPTAFNFSVSASMASVAQPRLLVPSPAPPPLPSLLQQTAPVSGHGPGPGHGEADPSASTTLHQGGADPNSPDLFRQNILFIQAEVTRLQHLARDTLAGIQNAYHPGANPAHTEAQIAALKQTIQHIVDILRHTGVGGLPLLHPETRPGPGPHAAAPGDSTVDATLLPTIVLPAEEQLMADTERSIEVLFERLRRSQESAAVVANLLGSAAGVNAGTSASASASASADALAGARAGPTPAPSGA